MFELLGHFESGIDAQTSASQLLHVALPELHRVLAESHVQISKNGLAEQRMIEVSSTILQFRRKRREITAAMLLVPRHQRRTRVEVFNVLMVGSHRFKHSFFLGTHELSAQCRERAAIRSRINNQFVEFRRDSFVGREDEAK